MSNNKVNVSGKNAPTPTTRPMSNSFYPDASGQKQGPVNEQSQTLMAPCVITPSMPLETENGHKTSVPGAGEFHVRSRRGQISISLVLIICATLIAISFMIAISIIFVSMNNKSRPFPAPENRSDLSDGYRSGTSQDSTFTPTQNQDVTPGSSRSITSRKPISTGSQGQTGSVKPFTSHFKDIFAAAAQGTVQDVQFHLEIILELGVNDINSTNDYGYTPLHCAAMYNKDVEVTKFLINKGARVGDENYKLRGGFTALDFARQSKNTAVVEYLESIKAPGSEDNPVLHPIPGAGDLLKE